MSVVAPDQDRAGPLIFVVTPYYKESLEWLQRCHDSVMNQDVEARVRHILIADGHPRPEIDAWNAVHIRLPTAHGDNGNTPRAVGSAVAQTNGADFIAFLDADNWYYSDHLASMLEGYRQTGAKVICAWRDFYDAEGKQLDIIEEDEVSFGHVDTSGYMLHKSCFDMNSMWSSMPRILSPWCDRVFFSALKNRRLMLCFTKKRSVAFTTIYKFHFDMLGVPAPANAKVPPIPEMVAYLRSEHGARELVSRIGFLP